VQFLSGEIEVTEVADGWLLSLTEAVPFSLQSETRAEQRAEWERHRQEKELEVEQRRLEREKERREAEERELQQARAASVHVANPVRQYKPLPQRDVLPLTMPESPNFSDRFSK